MQKSEIQHRPRNTLQHPQNLIIEIHQRWTVKPRWCLPDSPKPVSPKLILPKPDSPKLGLGLVSSRFAEIRV